MVGKTSENYRLLFRLVCAIDTYLLGRDKDRFRAYIGKLHGIGCSNFKLTTNGYGTCGTQDGADRLAGVLKQGIGGGKQRHLATIEACIANACCQIRTGIEKGPLKKGKKRGARLKSQCIGKRQILEHETLFIAYHKIGQDGVCRAERGMNIRYDTKIWSNRSVPVEADIMYRHSISVADGKRIRAAFQVDYRRYRRSMFFHY